MICDLPVEDVLFLSDMLTTQMNAQIWRKWRKVPISSSVDVVDCWWCLGCAAVCDSCFMLLVLRWILFRRTAEPVYFYTKQEVYGGDCWWCFGWFGTRSCMTLSYVRMGLELGCRCAKTSGIGTRDLWVRIRYARPGYTNAIFWYHAFWKYKEKSATLCK